MLISPPHHAVSALSLLQPWATLLALGFTAKEWETRGFYTSHRGVTAIHASKGEKDLKSLFSVLKAGAAAGSFEWYCQVIVTNLMPGVKLEDCFPLGCVLAIGELAEVRRVETLDGQITGRERLFGNYAAGRGRWAWRFQNVKRLETPIPATGALGFWRWDPAPVIKEEIVIHRVPERPRQLTLF